MISFQMDFVLEPGHFDESGNIKASHLLYLFQKIAADHATHLGIGFQEMIQKNLIWVIAKLRYRLNGKLLPNTAYKLITYPKPRRALSYQRDYYIYAATPSAADPGTTQPGVTQPGTEQPVAVATSQWCILNFQTRKIEPYEYCFDGETSTAEPFADAYPRIRPKSPVPAGSHTVLPEDLDENEHTNNSRYADLFCSAAGRSDLKEMTIHFQKESRLGDEILLFREEGDGTVTVIGKTNAGENIFQAVASYRS